MSSSAVSPSIDSIAPLKYDPSMEKREADEAETLAELIETMRGISETTYKDYGRAVRSVHAKAHGLLNGTLTVLPNVPAMFAHGLFAKPGASYPTILRISTIPGDILDDSISTPRGLAIKVLGVSGDRLPGSENDSTQDFVLVNAPAFSAADTKAFLKTLKLLAATTDQPQALKKAASAINRAAEVVVEAFGGKSPALLTMGGTPETNPLGEIYYSQAPLLHGPYMAKISVAPVSPELAALQNAPVDLDDKPNGLRQAVADFFRTHGGEWEVRVQLCTDLKAMPIEDASVVWPEDRSPYIPVARISVPAQEAWSAEKERKIDQGMSFGPWHGLAAHRPIGSIMRARKTPYDMSARFRAEHNKQPIVEPKLEKAL